MLFRILSVIVEVYLWWKWHVSLIFLSGRTCTIGGWLNTFLPHCICDRDLVKRSKNTLQKPHSVLTDTLIVSMCVHQSYCGIYLFYTPFSPQLRDIPFDILIAATLVVLRDVSKQVIKGEDKETKHWRRTDLSEVWTIFICQQETMCWPRHSLSLAEARSSPCFHEKTMYLIYISTTAG